MVARLFHSVRFDRRSWLSQLHIIYIHDFRFPRGPWAAALTAKALRLSRYDATLIRCSYYTDIHVRSILTVPQFHHGRSDTHSEAITQTSRDILRNHAHTADLNQ